MRIRATLIAAAVAGAALLAAADARAHIPNECDPLLSELRQTHGAYQVSLQRLRDQSGENARILGRVPTTTTDDQALYLAHFVGETLPIFLGKVDSSQRLAIGVIEEAVALLVCIQSGGHG